MYLSVSDLTTGYGRTQVLGKVSFSAQGGEFIALIGPNGSGKSTLIKAIATILDAWSGTITINDSLISAYSPNQLALLIGYVPQSFRFIPFTTVTDLALLGRKPHVTWSLSDRDLGIVQDAVTRMGISPLAAKFVDEISGGERQKAFIARALAQEPELFLFDEPTSSLDVKHQIEVCRIMQDVAHTEGKTVILAVHDLNLAYRFADRIVLLSEGSVIAEGEPDEVMTPRRIRDVYQIDIQFIDTGTGRYLIPVMA